MKRNNLVINEIILVLVLLLPAGRVIGQLNLTTQSGINNYCGGCSYNLSSILINELMISPDSGDGSIFGNDLTRRGEWIELYNPDSCCKRDISCYFLGNCAPDGDPEPNYGGGFEIPPGNIIPPSGFVIVRGTHAGAVPPSLLVQNGGRTVEIVVDTNLDVCIGMGSRLWFPNAGGWFAFYDETGVPQDAIFWNDSLNFDHTGNPCNPIGGCPFSGVLCSFEQIPANKKTYISSYDPVLGESFRREPDGGPWVIGQQGIPTYGTCNILPCAQLPPCDGNITVSASGGTPPYTYQWSDCREQNTNSATSLCAGNYCVTVTDALGIQATICDSVSNKVIPVSLNAFAPVCENADPFLLSGGYPPGGHFSGPGVIADTLYPVLSGPGYNQIKYTYVNQGCYGFDSVIILIYPSPVAIAATTDDSLCSGETIWLSGQAYGGNSLSCSFSWNGPAGFDFNDAQASIPLATPSNSGYYTLVVTDTLNCSSVFPDTVPIQVFPRPQAHVLFSDSIVCEGENIILYAYVSGGTPPNEYEWQGPAGFSSGLLSPFLPAVTPQLSGYYIFNITDSHQCTAENPDSLELIISPLPVISAFPSELAICRDSTAEVQLSGASQYYLAPNQGVSLTLMGILLVNASFNTNYIIIGVDQWGCSGQTNLHVSVYPKPVPGLPDTLFLCAGESLILKANTGDSATYIWQDNSRGNSCQVSQPGLCWVLMSNFMCRTFDSAWILPCTEFWIPNTFTPNTDGNNDVFRAFTSQPLAEYEMIIFNRWGDKIFITNDIEAGWDGCYKGETCMSDVYVYLVTYLPVEGRKHQRQGMVFLIR
ncbi:MAG: gliding motility-associated C-terminal domain-containing protein [Bacteroidetes bacterium]|nr:gliding motility-associated C-terminal domain-containing protein [Bacteroidota bacterium]